MENILVTAPFKSEQKSQMQILVPDWPIVFTSYSEVTNEMIAKSTIIIGNVPIPLLASARSLKWMQLSSSGASQFGEKLDDEILLTCSTGAFGSSVSEHLLAILFAVMKNLPFYLAEQQKSNWVQFLPQSLIEGSTVLVIGTGDIGSSFARKVQALGATTLGCKRTPSPPIPGFDAIYTVDQLDIILPQADIIVLALPETTSTTHLIDKKKLLLMKKDAIIANGGRGSAIDTEALCDVMESGHLAAAALDVTEQEPLPSNHRLWTTPRVLITPHAGGGFLVSNTLNRIFDISYDNLRRYKEGKPLLNNVDRKTGYVESTTDGDNL